MDNEIYYLKLDDIIPNRFQPREIFDESALNELADSIKQHGVIQPIVVRQIGNKYEIIAGERRYKASAMAGLTKIPAIIKNLDDKESSIVAYAENAHRRNVSSIEEARTMERILKNNNLTQNELANELGLSQSALANKLRLLTLPVEIQDSLMKNEISERHARSLLSLKDERRQLEFLDKIKRNKMTVRELDSEIRDMNNDNKPMDDVNVGLIDRNNLNMNIPNSTISVSNGVNNSDINDDFMSYLNNPNASFNQVQEETHEETNNVENNDDFMSYLNNPNASFNQVQEEIHEETNNVENNNDFMSFLNNPNASFNQVSEEIHEETNNVENNNDDFMSFLNNPNASFNEVQEEIHEETNNVENNNDFMSYLNNPNASFNEVQEEIHEEINNVQNNNDDFMSYLNNPSASFNQAQEETQDVNNDDFSQYLNTVDQNYNTNDNYIENDSRYVDVEANGRITSFNGIISKLKDCIEEIKNSDYKIDSDEIDFGDIYQITIKIDKRDIL